MHQPLTCLVVAIFPLVFWLIASQAFCSNPISLQGGIDRQTSNQSKPRKQLFFSHPHHPAQSQDCCFALEKITLARLMDCRYRRPLFHLFTLRKHIEAKIHHLSKNSNSENLIFWQIHIFKVSFFTNSQFQNLIFHKKHFFEISFFTKFTNSKSHFLPNSQIQSPIFHKIHIFKASFFTKFTISKSHFSQN